MALALSGEEIRALREKAHLSQAVFAHYLNLTVGYVSQLERGARHPLLTINGTETHAISSARLRDVILSTAGCEPNKGHGTGAGRVMCKVTIYIC